MKNILLFILSLVCIHSAMAQCAGTCADDKLSDLAAPTAINASLLTGTTALDLGSSSAEWENIYMNPNPTATGDDVFIYYSGGIRFLHNNGGNTGATPEGLFLGESAGAGASGSNSGCVGIGYAALKAMTTGNHNTAIGWRSLYNVSGTGAGATGDKNTMGGSRAGQRISTGQKNTGLGHNVFYQGDNTENTAYITGTGNIGIGAAADIGTPIVSYGVLGLLTSGSYNSVFGFGSGINITIGNHNNIFGDNSGTDIDDGNNNNIIGTATAVAITSGSDNIVVGNGAAATLTTGTDNILIGNGADVTTSGATEVLNLGNTIYGDLSSGSVGIGSSTITELFNVGSSTQFRVNNAGKVVASNGQTAATDGNGVPVIIKVIDIDDADQTIGPTDLVDMVEVTGGLYRISFHGLITVAASTSSSLTMQVVYTDPDAGTNVSVPRNYIEDITKTTSNVVNSSSFSGSFIIKATASTDIRYKVTYSSTGATPMQYAIRVIVEKI